MEKLDLQNNIPEIETREERREKLYDKLEAKVQTITDLREFADTIADIPLEELKDQVKEKQDEILEGIKSFRTDRDIESDFQALMDLSSKNRKVIKRARNTKEYFGDKDFDVDNLYQNLQDKNYEERLKIFSEILEYEEDLDLAYLKKIAFFFENIVLKKDTVLALEESYNRDSSNFFNNYIKEQTGLDISSLEIQDCKIKFSGYSVIVELNEDVFNDHVGDTSISGQSYSNTVIVFIKNQEGKELTERHEKNHQLSDSFVDRVYYSENFLKNLESRIDTYHHYKKIEIDSYFLEKEKQYIITDLRSYVNENFSEIVADIDAISEGKIKTFFNNFLNVCSKLDGLLVKIDDDNLKNAVNQTMDDMIDDFNGYMNKVSDIFSVSSNLGDVEIAKSTIILFNQVEIKKAEKFIAHHFGESNYEFIKNLKSLIYKGGNYFEDIGGVADNLIKDYSIAGISEGKSLEDISDSKISKFLTELKATNIPTKFFDINNLKNCIELIDKGNLDINDDLRTKIVSSLNSLDVSMYFLENNRDIENLKEVDDLLNELSVKMEIKELSIFSNILGSGYIKTASSICLLKKDYDSLLELYDKYPLDKKHFRKGVVDTVKNLSSNDLLKDYINFKDINFINFLKNVGIDKI